MAVPGLPIPEADYDPTKSQMVITIPALPTYSADQSQLYKHSRVTREWLASDSRVVD